MNLILIFLIGLTSAFPSKWLQRIAEGVHIQDFENYLPKLGEFPKYEYSTFNDNKLNIEEVEFKSHEELTFNNDSKLTKGELFNETEAALNKTVYLVENGTQVNTASFNKTLLTTLLERLKNARNSSNPILDPVLANDTNSNSTLFNRPSRQEENNAGEDTGSTTQKPARQEEEEESSEEDQNMLTGLLSAFLGGLSRPDGSVDVEAITGLLGSLSQQREDGSYDFNGLTELLMGFFGGDDEGGGGSDFGAFLGGLAGAFIKGVAKPPGSRGAGIFTGNLLTAILPGLSGPAPPPESEDGSTLQPPTQGLDSGGFLGGLLQSLLRGLGGMSSNISGSSSGGNGGQPSVGGSGSKFPIIKAVVSMISSVVTSSSANH